jgi:hypothetical protein
LVHHCPKSVIDGVQPALGDEFRLAAESIQAAVDVEGE